MKIERLPTGIQGFDEIISGGLVKRSVNLVSGAAGTGKSIFCMNFIFNGAKMFQERGLYISFEESEEDLKSDVIQLGLDFEEVSELVRFLYIPPYDVNNFPAYLEQELLKFIPKRVVIDSVTSLITAMEDDFERRKEIFQVIRILKESGCTSLLISERGGDASEFSKFGMEEFLSDSLLLLNLESMGGDYSRSLTVRKMRKTKHSEDVHPYEISEKGVIVHKLN